jgi:predicted dehydrogenase
MSRKENQAALSRREFLKDTALAGAAVLGGLAPARVLGANEKIRIALLGAGQRGQYDMSLFMKDPTIEVAAVCDVYEPHRDSALKAAGPTATAHLDYRDLLDRQDIDAVLIASPDHWHKQMLVDAVKAGKDVYCEKPIMHSIEEGQEMVKAVEETKRIVQTGMQQRSWDHYIQGKQIIDSGKLGKITFVHTYWYQNYAGREGWMVAHEVDQTKLDWKKFLGNAPDQAFSDEKYYHWRFFWDFGGGILTDLLTHWIDIIQWYLGQPAPKTATTTGELYNQKWQCPDTMTTAYEYPGDFAVTFTGALNSGIDDGGIDIRGTQGTLKIDRTRLAVYPEGVRSAPGTQAPPPEISVLSTHDGTLDHVNNFIACLRDRKTPNASIQAGFEAARTSWIGNIALKRGLKTAFDPVKNRVES